MQQVGRTSLAQHSLQELLILLSTGSDPEASLEYAYRLLHGLGMGADAEAALSQFHAAAELGSDEAMYNLSVCYLRGIGTRTNLALSRYWASRCELQLGIGCSDGAPVKDPDAPPCHEYAAEPLFQERAPEPRLGSRDSGIE